MHAHRDAVSRKWDGCWRVFQSASGRGGSVRTGVLVPPELDEEKKPEEGKEDEDERVALTDVEHSHLLVVAVGSLERCRAAA